MWITTRFFGSEFYHPERGSEFVLRSFLLLAPVDRDQAPRQFAPVRSESGMDTTAPNASEKTPAIVVPFG